MNTLRSIPRETMPSARVALQTKRPSDLLSGIAAWLGRGQVCGDRLVVGREDGIQVGLHRAGGSLCFEWVEAATRAGLLELPQRNRTLLAARGTPIGRTIHFVGHIPLRGLTRAQLAGIVAQDGSLGSPRAARKLPPMTARLLRQAFEGFTPDAPFSWRGSRGEPLEVRAVIHAAHVRLSTHLPASPRHARDLAHRLNRLRGNDVVCALPVKGGLDLRITLFADAFTSDAGAEVGVQMNLLHRVAQLAGRWLERRRPQRDEVAVA